MSEDHNTPRPRAERHVTGQLLELLVKVFLGVFMVPYMVWQKSGRFVQRDIYNPSFLDFSGFNGFRQLVGIGLGVASCGLSIHYFGGGWTSLASVQG